MLEVVVISRNHTEEQEIRSKIILISRWIVARELVQTQLHRNVSVNNDSKTWKHKGLYAMQFKLQCVCRQDDSK